jgi:DNA-binding transcriptional LysR family regulator
MNTHHLQYFHDAYRLRSVAASAQINHVAASTVSQAISILESELGFNLTVKKRGSLEFTQEAILFSKEALEILTLVSRSKIINQSKQENFEGIIRLATHQSYLNTSLWKVLREYKKLYPKVKVQLSTGLGSRLSEMIDRDMIDLTITADELSSHTAKHMSSVLIHQGHFRLVHAKKFKPHKDSPCIVTNVNKPEVVYLTKKAPQLVIESQVPSWTTIKKILENESLLGYLPDYLIEEDGDKRFKEVVSGKAVRYPYELKAWYSHKYKNHFILNKFLEITKKLP